MNSQSSSHSAQLGSQSLNGDNANSSEHGNKKKKKEDSVLGVPLAFPSVDKTLQSNQANQKNSDKDEDDGKRTGDSSQWTHAKNDPTPLLKNLRDEHSSYTIVAKTCLTISQFAGYGSQATTQDEATSTTTILDSVVLHDAAYAKIVSNTLRSLFECLESHKDRRSRILAAKTCAILGTAAYARIRPSPALYTVRDTIIVSRLEDEIGAELPTALATACLEQDDSGVSAAALDALGVLILFHSGMPGTQWAEDALEREHNALTSPGTSAYAPSLRSCVDEDPSIPATELAARILENVVQPRLWMMLERVAHYETTSALAMALPVLTAALVHQLQTTPALTFGMAKSTFAKQWTEVDAIGLCNTFVQSILLPVGLQESLDGHLTQAASLSALRLAEASPQMPWVTTLCRHVLIAQTEALSATPLPVCHKMSILATTLIAARAIPFPERTHTLLSLVEPILALPSTTRVPLGVTSPGLILQEYATRHHSAKSHNLLHHHQMQYGQHYRRPARITYWTELALSFFLDGPAPSPDDLKLSALADSSGHDNKGKKDSKKDGEQGGRQEAIRKFLSLPVIAKVISDSPTGSTKAPLVAKDELLLAFTGVAAACGRRFRGGAGVNSEGSAWPITDPGAPAVEEWLQLSWVVLTAFVPCVNMGRKIPYLEEDLSLATAGLTQYVQLLQEYLHFAGLLHPGSSVAVKLVANACPPHLLWDQLAESAAYMARFESLDMGLLENTTKLMDEIVARELKQGIPSHHMRLFLLALAADHWMQGRVAAIRKQFDASAPNHANNPPPSLDVQSAREIIMALSPKRMLAKIFHSHVPPVDSEGKKKKDPIKRLALETVRVCVACIENLALIACDWRKRFNSGGSTKEEPKHVVSVAVGVLQGKVDETPSNDTIRAIMAPVCDSAVGRIQAFYESDMGGADSFPASELVMQNVKTKIKPLVSSSSRPPVISKDDFARGYLMQLSRQIVMARIEQAIHSVPPADSELAPARTVSWLRLQVPPIADSRDGRLLGNRADVVAAFDKSIRVASAGSDPTAIVVAYTPRRYPRHDGEDEYRITALVRVYNTTAIEFTEGLRLELGLVNQGNSGFSTDAEGEQVHDNLEREVRRALGMSSAEAVVPTLASASVVCKQELKPGEFLSWEVVLDHATAGEGLSLLPSVVFRNVPIEPVDTGVKLVGEKSGTGDNSTINTGGESAGAGSTGEDDFQVTETENTTGRLKDADTPSENIIQRGEPLPLSPLVELQPCPLIFMRDRWGDVDAFRFLWFRMPYHLPEVPLADEAPENIMGGPSDNAMMRAVANMSCLVWNGEAIPGGYVTRAWAFATLSGKRVLAVMSESDSDKKVSLHMRGDDPFVLYGLIGAQQNRSQVVAALAPEFTPLLDY